MKIGRSCGVLMHITSLPGRHGTGTLGDEAREFIDTLHDAGMSYWQILPAGPVSPSMCHSPYSPLSSFAINELFISTAEIAGEDWCRSHYPAHETAESSFADFTSARDYAYGFLVKAAGDFFRYASQDEISSFNHFCYRHGREWLDDYCLFRALAWKFNTFNWLEWERGAAMRDADALRRLEEDLQDSIRLINFCQYIAFTQWNRIRGYAHSKGIKIIGDIPFYMSMDSADSWCGRDILDIDMEGMKPSGIAGVPPDYFSSTGQLWGNPVYRWHNGDGGLNEAAYNWWLRRMLHAFRLTDLVRIDHFRGFETFWRVEYGEETAEKGEWLPGPGRAFFDRLARDIGDLPVIAEDLGDITPEVKELRDRLDFPGMKILQFAFDHNSRNEYLPHNIERRHCVVYTGTHDNDTTNGWFYDPDMPEPDREYIMEYLGMNEWSDFHKRLIREAYATMADLVIIPAQDILGYGSEYRMNTPGTVINNWMWKLTEGAFGDELTGWLARMAAMFLRAPEPEEESGK